MTERTRQPSQGDFEASSEDKLLGPYPSWKRWNPALMKQIGEDNFKRFDPRLQDLLHRSYIIRRKSQLGLDVSSDFDEIKKLQDELGGVEKIRSNPKISFALDFINSR